MGTLYLVATPIGNLEDITLRALRVLKEVAAIAAEDTRTTRKLLSHYQIRQRLLSYNEHNMRARTPQLLALLKEADLALVSEAGTPAISDPGHELVLAAIRAGYPVVPVPGASALLAALVISGFDARRFTFLGFLPRRAGELRRLLQRVEGERRTLVAFESPHRLRRTLDEIRALWPERRIAVCREMTKAFEEVFRGTVTEAAAHFDEPRGEFTLVLEGAAADVPKASIEDIRNELSHLREAGAKSRDAVRRVAEATGRPHREVYRLWLEITQRG